MEAPEKADYGDLDFLVAGPKLAATSTEGVHTDVSHEDVQRALGAHSLIALPGTSNYAISITNEWRTHTPSDSSPAAEAEPVAVSCQVDVHVCADKTEWELHRFMHGYGDVGMILGLFARNVGLSLGTVGLKILTKIPGKPPFHLSSSVPEIAAFFGLALDAWERGFPTERAAFEWAATSRFFSVQRMKEAHSKKRRTETRMMYSRFVDWAQAQPVPETPVPSAEAVVAEALACFGKKAEYDGLMEEYRQAAAKIEARNALKVVFNGTIVGEWTGLDNRRVKIVMDKIRLEQAGGAGLLGLERSRIQQLVESAVDQLGYVNHAEVDPKNEPE
ncbi:hypothetical protein HWV62_14296 [Athelia sp. TMB]|nr:hypothetical protein HWV62_14296 [Athelia sp. TMB]